VAAFLPYTGRMNEATGPRSPSAWAEFVAAIIFLTRLPVPWRGPWPAGLNERALTWFPIVGALIGTAGGLFFWMAVQLGLPPGLAAALTIVLLLLLTGALHEDGLADVADGFGGGRDRLRKLEIMKDSRVGTYGAAALVLALLLKIGALGSLVDARSVALALIGAHAFSRGLLPALQGLLPPARRDGLVAVQARPNSARMLVAAIIGFSFAATCLGKLGVGGLAGIAVLLASVLPVLWLGRQAQRQIGGVTGDVLGAAQQLAEIGFLLGIVAARNAGAV
jgi:adenosylcobinamide-GDP ribazoletransferase